jgi:hypothetical protein
MSNKGISGNLLLGGPFNSEQFDKRWFVLSGQNTMSYFSGEEDAKKETDSNSALGDIDLADCSVEIVAETKYNRKYCFELTSPNMDQIFVLVAENGQTLQNWMTSIRRSMLTLRRNKKKKSKRVVQEEAQTTTTRMTLVDESHIAPPSTADSSSSSNKYVPPSATGPQDQQGLLAGQGQGEADPSATDSETYEGDEQVDEKYDVYRQWLNETKQSEAQRSRKRGLLGSGGSGDSGPCCCVIS